MAILWLRLRQLRDHRISRNASWVFLGQAANCVLQAAYFVLLARLLGVQEYGVFAGAFALVNLVTPYSALGGGLIFMRYVTTDRARAAVYWGNSLLLTALATSVMVIVLFWAGPALTRTGNHLLFVTLVLANCFFAQVANLGSMVFQTFEKMRWTALLSTATSLARLLVLLVMRITLHRATASQWAMGVLIASASAAVLTIVLVRRETGPAVVERSLMVRRLREGLGFSFAGTTQALYNDADKVMLSHYGLSVENGFYTLAYRVIDMATTPVASLDAAVLPRLFREGHAGPHKVIRLAIRSTAASLVIGAVVAVSLLLLAPIIAHLVGKDFSGVVAALRWLCWIPLLRGIHRATGSALTGAGRQRLRTMTQVTVAVVNVLLNLWWIPVYGWIGAAWSSLASDGLLAVFNGAMLLWGGKLSRRREEVNAIAESEVYS